MSHGHWHGGDPAPQPVEECWIHGVPDVTNIPKTTCADLRCTGVPPKPSRRWWVERTGGPAAQKSDRVPFDKTTIAAGPRGVVQGEEEERHPADDTAHRHFGSTLRHPLRRGGFAAHPPIGHRLDQASIHQSSADMTAED